MLSVRFSKHAVTGIADGHVADGDFCARDRGDGHWRLHPGDHHRALVADSLRYMPSVVDATDTEIDLERPAREVVSLVPSFTELVCSMRLGSRLVGRDPFLRGAC